MRASLGGKGQTADFSDEGPGGPFDAIGRGAVMSSLCGLLSPLARGRLVVALRWPKWAKACGRQTEALVYAAVVPAVAAESYRFACTGASRREKANHETNACLPVS